MKRRWKFGLGFATVGVALFLVSLAMVRWTGVVTYGRILWNLKPGLGMVASQNMPNFRGILAALTGHRPTSRLAYGVFASMVIAGVAYAAARWNSHGTDSTLRGFSSSIPVVLATSYYANSYDLTMLLLPLLALTKPLCRSQASAWQRTGLVASAATLLCTPLLWLLVLRADQACWLAIVVAVLAASTFAKG